MKNLVVGYFLVTIFCAGYLNAFNRFLPEAYQFGVLNVAGRSIIWPWTFGEIAVGVYMGSSLGDCRVETTEEFDMPEEEDTGVPRVFDGRLEV